MSSRERGLLEGAGGIKQLRTIRKMRKEAKGEE